MLKRPQPGATTEGYSLWYVCLMSNPGSPDTRVVLQAMERKSFRGPGVFAPSVICVKRYLFLGERGVATATAKPSFLLL